MIEMHNITKRFGGVPALDGASLRIEGGKVHGLLGENGAGKSTIMNVLFGLLRPDAGMIKVDGVEVRIGSPRAAQALGIGMVHQHFKLVPTLTVVENFALALGISVGKIRAEVMERMEMLGWSVPMDVSVETLAVGQQQRVEIVKALMAAGRGGGASERILILDEPTAVLTPQETAELFTALESLKRMNTAIIFISHKLGEVQRICDEVTILRRGRVVHTGVTHALSAEEMAERMIGAKVELPRLVDGAVRVRGAVAALELKQLSTGMLKNASLRVMPGEIVGIAGVDGNGQADLVQAIVGGMPERGASAGSIFLANENASRHSIRWRVDRLAYIAEDRHRQAVVLPLTIRDNVMLKDYRAPAFSTMGWLRFGKWRTHARELVQRFDVRCNSVADPVGRLSGGNQQKVVLARELHDGRKPLVIAVNPTRGLDIGATAFVMRQLLEARGRGAGVLLVHSDLDELLAISDRVFVLYDGRLMESEWPNATKEDIGKMMLGVTGDRSKQGDAA